MHAGIGLAHLDGFFHDLSYKPSTEIGTLGIVDMQFLPCTASHTGCGMYSRIIARIRIFHRLIHMAHGRKRCLIGNTSLLHIRLQDDLPERA